MKKSKKKEKTIEELVDKSMVSVGRGEEKQSFMKAGLAKKIYNMYKDNMPMAYIKKHTGLSVLIIKKAIKKIQNEEHINQYCRPWSDTSKRIWQLLDKEGLENNCIKLTFASSNVNGLWEKEHSYYTHLKKNFTEPWSDELNAYIVRVCTTQEAFVDKFTPLPLEQIFDNRTVLFKYSDLEKN